MLDCRFKLIILTVYILSIIKSTNNVVEVHVDLYTS